VKKQNHYLFLIRTPWSFLFLKTVRMKNQFALKQLVGNVAQTILPNAVNRYSFFVNDIAPDLQVSVDKDLLASILGKLLQTAVTQTENDCIRISAYQYQEQVFLNVHENGRCYGADLFNRMEQMTALATALGGTVAVTPAPKGLELSLRFTNEA
jgi:K+-sensing histidine kinase KdpD